MVHSGSNVGYYVSSAYSVAFAALPEDWNVIGSVYGDDKKNIRHSCTNHIKSDFSNGKKTKCFGSGTAKDNSPVANPFRGAAYFFPNSKRSVILDTCDADSAPCTMSHLPSSLVSEDGTEYAIDVMDNSDLKEL